MPRSPGRVGVERPIAERRGDRLKHFRWTEGNAEDVEIVDYH